MKRALALVLLCAVPAVGVGLASADHRWNGHWPRSSNPAEVKVVDSTTGAWRDAVAGAARRWSKKSSVIDISVAPGDSSGSTRQSCPAPKGGVRICNGNYSGSWAGLTEVTVAGQHFQAASIKINEGVAGGAKRAVMCHEIGHALGLDHRPGSDTSSCMTAAVSASQTKPDGHDLKMLKKIYRHADGGGTPGASDVRVIRIYSFT